MKTLRLKVPDTNKLIYGLFLLSVFNIFLLGSYLIMFGALVVFLGKKHSINKTLLILLFFALSFVTFSVISGANNLLNGLRVMIFPCAYYLGRNLQFEAGIHSTKHIVIHIAIFMAMHMVLNFFYNFREMGFEMFTYNAFRDIFSGNVSAATGQVTYAYVFCSILGYFFFMNYGTVQKITCLTLYFLMLTYNFALGGRTFLLLSLMSVVVGMFVYVRSKKNWKDTGKILLSVGALVSILLILYTGDVFGIQTTIQKSYFYRRFFLESNYRVDIFSDMRLTIKLDYVRNMLLYPFGGGMISDTVGEYAHELWLDTYDAAGIIPYMLLILYTVTSEIRIYRFARRNDISGEERMILISFLLILLVSFFLEPIISGAPMVFAAYCFLDGVVSKYQKSDGI